VYEDLKRIMKEMLTNGARRDIYARFEVNDGRVTNRVTNDSSLQIRQVTPYELLYNVKDDVPINEFNSLRIVLVGIFKINIYLGQLFL
jgi:hypothetical protein